MSDTTPAFTLDDTVNAVAEKDPAAREILARHGLDLCCGGVHPLKVAAQAHGVDGEALLAELNAPAWARVAPQHEVDVREDLRGGLEPLAKIVAAVAKVGPGEVLKLRAIFEPKPLYKLLAIKGFEHWTRREASDDWSVWFRKRG